MGCIEWVNAAFTRITEYELHETIGKRPGQFLQGPGTDPETVKETARKLREEVPFTVEILNYSKSGNSYWLRMDISPIFNDNGELVNFIAVETDLTEQKAYEQELKMAKIAAEEGAKAKSEFLANMSHEIRTPMNAVIGMTGLLLDTDLREDQREFVETIRVSGDNLLTIINDILDFSKIDAGHLELEQQSFSLPEIIEDVLDLLSSKSQAQGLELLYEAEPNTPSQIISDPTRLNQVLLNLISNAIKFTHEGEVSLSIKEIKRIGQVSQLQFSIRDTGIGIPPEKVDTLFKPFVQVDASTTRKYGGTGLGLAICIKLVQLMGGNIWVESEEGQGSVFHFTIRTKVDSEETFSTYVSPTKANLLEGKRALLVDDNYTNLRILKAQLASWGIESVTCAFPMEASELVRTHTFDFLILDMHMPLIDGYQLAIKLKSEFGETLPPLLMLTSLGQAIGGPERDLFHALMHKPVRREQLYRHLHRAITPNSNSLGVRREIVAMELPPVMPPLRILVAEDNLVNQKVARRMLEKLGYQPEFVATGLEAVEILRHHFFDLIFMDMRMPVMDGIEATQKIRQIYGLRGPVICAMTANAMKGDRDLCLEAGMNDYIAKPVKTEALRDAILRSFGPEAIVHVQSA